jgi:hypothetical protein
VLILSWNKQQSIHDLCGCWVLVGPKSHRNNFSLLIMIMMSHALWYSERKTSFYETIPNQMGDDKYLRRTLPGYIGASVVLVWWQTLWGIISWKRRQLGISSLHFSVHFMKLWAGCTVLWRQECGYCVIWLMESTCGPEMSVPMRAQQLSSTAASEALGRPGRMMRQEEIYTMLVIHFKRCCSTCYV